MKAYHVVGEAPMYTNTFLLISDSGSAAVIDPAAAAEDYNALLQKENAVLTDKETYMSIWQKAIADSDSDPLRAFRSKQMMELAEHAPYTAFEAALVNKTLQRCEVNCNRTIDFFFLDGSSKQVQL